MLFSKENDSMDPRYASPTGWRYVIDLSASGQTFLWISCEKLA